MVWVVGRVEARVGGRVQVCWEGRRRRCGKAAAGEAGGGGSSVGKVLALVVGRVEDRTGKMAGMQGGVAAALWGGQLVGGVVEWAAWLPGHVQLPLPVPTIREAPLAPKFFGQGHWHQRNGA